jgi:predicted SAM-dependent methyltransferase
MTTTSIKHRLGPKLLRRVGVTRFLFELVRVEWNARMTGVHNAISPRRRTRLRKLRQLDAVFVNVACGPSVLPEFVNLDLYHRDPNVVLCDCRKALPLADDSALGILVEHFAEHLEPREEFPMFLRDCHRVLKREGVLRVVVPDAEKYIRAYCEPGLDGFHRLKSPVPFPDDLPTRMDLVNHVFHQWHEHRWGYDFETLAHRLTTAGFRRVERMEFRRSLRPELAVDREVHAPYSLYVDAVK